jgi:hypothetical protein
MTAVRLPTNGRWAWDQRGDGRAVRVSTHAEAGVVNVSLWRDDVCVGTARLAPSEAAGLIGGLTDGLAELAARPAPQASASTERLHELELRLARLEHVVRPPVWRRVPGAVLGWAVTKAARAGRPRPAAPATLTTA